MGQVDLPWHVRDVAGLRKLEAELASAYPTLRVAMTTEHLVIKGSFPVRNGAEVLDRYSVEIQLHADHPRGLPIVREVGGRIPRLLDRHVLGDGSACVVLPDAYWLDNAAGVVVILDFLDGPLRDFFLGQSLVELGDPWPQGEWAHGAKGMVQHYSKLFGVESSASICALLLASSKPPAKGHHPCPCGSGRHYRRCHRSQVELLKERVPEQIRLRTVEALLEHMKRREGSEARPP